ncbi:MAG: Multidrug resistance protein MdtN [Deltaproteobacteria bacterium ADurb.Bin510]|nr:MAG: Multidrug resistance protein MdtN [Deltaproteobacteria bacterium ADurb.Bin510]
MKAKSGVDLSVKTYQRVQRLYAEGGVSAQKRDEAETQMQAAVETERAARAVYDMAQAGARAEDKAAASAQVEQASGAVSEVEAYLREMTLKAPARGEISTIVAQQGEIVSAGYPIINLVDLSDLWITFNLREDLMARIRMGEEFDATFPALGNTKIRLKVSYINALGSYATWNATKTSGDFDMKTFEVRARPVKPDAALRPGMTALLDWDSLKRR